MNISVTHPNELLGHIHNNKEDKTSVLSPPTILQDDMPLQDHDNNTIMSFDCVHSAMMDTTAPSALTDTLSSFSSNHSGFFGGGESINFNNGNTLSTYSSTASTTASRRSSMQFTRPVEVKETLDAFVTENADGLRQLKQYILKQEIGKGAFGKVHLGVDENTGTPYAVKEFSKSKLRKKDKTNLFKLGPRGRGRGMRGPSAPSPTSTAESSPLDLIRGEIAILKKLNHPNIVKLYEVLDVANDDSMYMVFEFCEKGVLMPVSLTKTFNKSLFTDEMCRDLFQQIVLGIEYLHEHDIIHRDIKPDNLLLTEGNIVKIVDFGVSEMFDKKGNDMTKKSAGSPAFMAPELCRHDHGEVSGRATDIWSMGVTLYCLRYGRLPYVSESILEMQRIIREEDFELPDEQDARFVDLIEGLLEKDPTKRVTIDQLRDDPWLTNNGNDQLISKEENTIHAVTEVTEEDLRGAIQKINGLVTVFKAIARFKRGLRNSIVHSAAVSPTSDILPESERMQDADESPDNNEQILTPLEGTKSHHEQTPSGSLERMLNRVNLENTFNTEKSDENKPKTEATTRVDLCLGFKNFEQENPTLVATQASQTKSSHEVAETKDESEEVSLEEHNSTQKGPVEPEGYQVCDMETGLCYWVPANKVKFEPDNATQEKAKQEDVSKEGIYDTRPSETSEQLQPQTQLEPVPAIGIADVPAIVTASTTEFDPEPQELDSHQYDQPHVKMTSKHSVDDDNTNSTDIEPSSSASASVRSLNPGPRLVGKLSPERLAMFEKNK